MLLLGTAAWFAARDLPGFAFELHFRNLIAASIGLGGLALNILPKLAFQRARTTVNPLRPSSTSQLVTSGVYRHTRNPMYLGQALILLGWALYLRNAAALMSAPLFMLYISRFQIQPEERFLSNRFSQEFAMLCKQAPRWL